jgi:hypothetical protein
MHVKEEKKRRIVCNNFHLHPGISDNVSQPPQHVSNPTHMSRPPPGLLNPPHNPSAMCFDLHWYHRPQNTCTSNCMCISFVIFFFGFSFFYFIFISFYLRHVLYMHFSCFYLSFIYFILSKTCVQLLVHAFLMFFFYFSLSSFHLKCVYNCSYAHFFIFIYFGFGNVCMSVSYVLFFIFYLSLLHWKHMYSCGQIKSIRKIKVFFCLWKPSKSIETCLGSLPVNLSSFYGAILF